MRKDVIDLDEALERTGDDIDLVVELLEVFIEDYPVKMRALRDAAGQKNITQLKDVAHAMKGASGNISAKRMREIFLSIENAGGQDEIAGIEGMLNELDTEFDDVKAYYAQLKKRVESK